MVPALGAHDRVMVPRRATSSPGEVRCSGRHRGDEEKDGDGGSHYEEMPALQERRRMNVAAVTGTGLIDGPACLSPPGWGGYPAAPAHIYVHHPLSHKKI